MGRFRRMRLDGFLSFEPGSEALDLEALNVLIGPNASGKSNVLEAFELLSSTPGNFADAVRYGGGAEEWLWKGESGGTATLDFEIEEVLPRLPQMRYRLEFKSVRYRTEIIDEAIEDVEPRNAGEQDVCFYYRFQNGHPVINERVDGGESNIGKRGLKREDFLPDQSVLSQVRDIDRYPEMTAVGELFGNIQIFRDWTFGRDAVTRRPQSSTFPSDRLFPGGDNLALVLNMIEHSNREVFEEHLRRFFPRIERMSTQVTGGSVQFYLHEAGLNSPIPATRLSDGTIRFMALLAALLSPSPPGLLCIEEPELGLHPDAVSMMADLIVEASERMQLVVTTHSESFLSGLSENANAVITCERLGAGTVLHRLDPKRLAHWMDKYTLGDLWSMGELGANP